MNVTYHYRGLAQEIISGTDVIDTLGARLDRAGAERAFVIHGPRIAAESDVVMRVVGALGDRFVGSFGGVQTHSPVEVLEEARDAAARAAPDVLVSVGGGSTVGIAKGVALLSATDRSIYDFEVRFEPPARVIEPSVPLPPVRTVVVAVATTMGCPEIGPSGGGFADKRHGRKIIVAGAGTTCPRTIFFDGRALATTPSDIQRATTIGQLRVAIESFTARTNNPIGDALALEAVRSLSQQIADGWSDDVHALLRLKSACALASMAMVAVGTLGLNSAIAHHVGAVHDVPHGLANAILLPHTLRWNAEAVPAARRARLAEALGAGLVDGGASADGVTLAARVAELSAVLGVPSRLRDVAVPEDGLAGIADATLGDRGLATNAREVHDREPVLALLQEAW